MMLGIAKIYKGLTEFAHKEALEWCKACIQRRIDQDHLEDRVDWSELIVDDIRLDEFGTYKMTCYLPLHDLPK